MGIARKVYKPSKKKISKKILGKGAALGTGAAISEGLMHEDIPESAILAGEAALIGGPYTAKKVISDKIKKQIGSKVAKLPLKSIPLVGWGMVLNDILSLGGPPISDALAKSYYGKGATSKIVRDVYSEGLRELQKGTKKRMRKNKEKSLLRFGKTNRKEGGRVGKPKGVGAALRGYGRAM